MKWWHLSLLGAACTIGTGYFLGTSVGIGIGGPALTIGFLLAAAGAFVVFDVLARMTADDPKEGSFCAYAGEAFGRWAPDDGVILVHEVLVPERADVDFRLDIRRAGPRRYLDRHERL
jgi:hypothetical protein